MQTSASISIHSVSLRLVAATTNGGLRANIQHNLEQHSCRVAYDKYHLGQDPWYQFALCWVSHKDVMIMVRVYWDNRPNISVNVL